MSLSRKWFGLCITLIILTLLPLSALAQTNPPSTATPRVSLYGPLVYGDYVRGSVNEDVPAAIYTFEGEAGDRVTITMTSDDFTAYLAIRDAEQQVLVSDEAVPPDTEAQIASYELPADGTYIIRAGAFGGGVKGAYELRLELSKPVRGCQRHGH